MEIKPVKKYIKPRYAAAFIAAAAVVSSAGCKSETDAGGTTSVTENALAGVASALGLTTTAAPEGTVTTTPEGTVTTTEDLTIAGGVDVPPDTEIVELSGDVAVVIEDDLLTGIAPVVTDTELDGEVCVSTEDEPVLAGDVVVASETEPELEGVPVVEPDFSDIDDVVFDGDVVMPADTEPLTATDVPVDAPCEFLSVEERKAISGESIKNAAEKRGISFAETEFQLNVERGIADVSYISDNVLLAFYESYDGCERDGSLCNVLGDIIGRGEGDKFSHGYVLNVTAEESYTLICVDLGFGACFDDDAAEKLLDELCEMGYIK